MPRRHEYDPIYSLSIYARFWGQFFLKFSQEPRLLVFLEKDCNLMRKKDRCARCVGCNNDRLFPEKYTVKFSFLPKKHA